MQFRRSVLVWLASALACNGGGGSSGGSDGDTSAASSGASSADTASSLDSASSGGMGVGCAELGKACVAPGSSLRTALVFEDADHPVVGYEAGDGIVVARWSGSAWEQLGSAISGRDTLGSGFGLHVSGDAPHLVSAEGSGAIHIQGWDGDAWTDVAGSPFEIPGGSGGVSFHSTSRDGRLHVVAANAGGIDPFHVRSYDGTMLTSATADDGAAAGLFAASPRIGVDASGTLWVVYRIPAGLAVGKNVPGTTEWTLGAATTDGEYWDDGALVVTPSGPVVARTWSPDHTIVVFSGDGASWTGLGSADGVVETGTDIIGYPALVADAADRAVLVIPLYASFGDVQTRVRRWDGAAWSTLADGEATFAPGFAPATLSATLAYGTLAVVSARRSDPSLEYLRYEEFPIP